MDSLAKFAERLKDYMNEYNKNGATLAKELVINPTSISEYLRGLHYPSTKILYKLLIYFNCSADYLLGITDKYNEQTIYKEIPPFGARIRKVMNFCKFSQYKLEKELNLSGDIVYKWLFDKSLPTVVSLIKIAKHMECTVDFLIGRID